MAGGLRTGSAQAEVARLTPTRPASRHRPPPRSSRHGRAGSSAVGPRVELERSARSRGLPARAVRPPRRARWSSDARPRRSTHPSALRRQPRGRARAASARGGLHGDPRGRRRDPVDRRKRRGRPRRTASRHTAGAGSTRCSATGRRRSRRSPATGWTLPTELRLLDVAHELGREGPIDIVPTYLGAHAVPPEFRARPDGVEAYVRHILEEQLPGVAAQGRARFCDVFCEEGAFTADQSERILRAAADSGWACGCMPMRSFHREGPSSRRSSAPPRPTTSRRRPRPASTPSPPRRPTADRSSRRCCRRRRGSS